jgi:hypothetical protein
MLRLGSALAIHCQQLAKFAVPDCLQQSRFPAQGRTRQDGCGNGVPDIVLTIAIRPLAVFPGFPPVDARQADQEIAAGGST